MRKIIPILSVLMFLTTCSEHKKSDVTNEIDVKQLLEHVNKTQEVEQSLAAIDSLEQIGEVHPPTSDYLRGLVYDMGWHYRLAGYYYQRAYDAYEEPIPDWDSYAKTGYRLAIMRSNMQDYEGSMIISSRLIAQADSLRSVGSSAFPQTYHAGLLSHIADCQISLRQFDEAKINKLKSYELMTIDDSPKNRMQMIFNNAESFFIMGDLEDTDEWLQLAEDKFEDWASGVNNTYIDRDLVLEYAKAISLLRANILQSRGKVVEAANAYISINDTNLLRHPINLDLTVQYLMAASRYEEALGFMNRLDTLSPPSEQPRITFEIIRDRMVPRYEAYLKSGHKDEALNTATQIIDAIDSAVVIQNRNAVAELSVIYETEQKDRALEQKEAESRMQLIINMGLLILLIVSGVALWRIIIAQRQLHQKNRELYDTIQQMQLREEEQQAALSDLPETTMNAQQKLYQRICQLMKDQHPYTDSTLNRDSLAQLLNTNYNNVAIAIRECADGLTVGDFIDNWRISHASQLLANSDEPIGIVIELSGFQSRSHFNTLFREKYKMPPSEYRIIAHEKRSCAFTQTSSRS